jgi:simple sugar transport system ATP-binding protein
MVKTETPRLQLKNISKRFPQILANDRITLSIDRGEIHALLGENGAGKTTLMNIVYGLLQPNEGEIYLDGRLITVRSPREAIKHRIGMVHQHFMLVPTLTVTENIILGMRPLSHLLTDLKQIEQDITLLSKRVGLQINPSAIVSSLSVGEQQRVEIVKALYKGVDVLILDEPTGVLTPDEAKDLFTTLKGLSEAGLSIIFITHKLNEVFAIADRVTVLRDGRLVNSLEVNKTNLDELAFMMVDRKVNFEIDRPETLPGKPVLVINQLVVGKHKEKPILAGISLEVCEGEILGIAGVDGNGQHELAFTITGLMQPDSGNIILNGKDITDQSIRHRIEAGMGHIPGDRHMMGLVLDFSVANNLMLQGYYRPPFTQYALLNLLAITAHAQRLVKSFDIRTSSLQTQVAHLSGGNQQRVILAREIDRNPHLLIAVQPTRGLDIGATEYIHSLLLEQKARGSAILLISTELDEVLALSDRIAVIFEGRIMGEVSAKGFDLQRIGRMMAGLPVDAPD